MKHIGLALIVTAASTGCGLAPQPACVGESECCPPWSRFDGAGCVARRWSEPTSFGGDNLIEPFVVVGDDGHLSIAWNEASLGVAVAREQDGLSVQHPPDAAAEVSEPRLAAAETGRLDLVWRDVSTASPAIRHGFFDGEQWSWPSEALSFSLDGNEPEVVAAGDEVIIAWNQWTGRNWGVATATSRGGESLRRPSSIYDVLSPRVNFSNNPDIALNQDGEAAITWFQDAGDGLMTFVSERPAGSEYFTHPVRSDAISPLDADVDNPVIALSRDGEIAVAWRQELGDGTYAILMATRDASGLWQTPASLEERMTDPADVVFRVDVAFAGSGDLYLVWQERVGEDSGVFVMHRDPDGRWVTPIGSPLRLSSPNAVAFNPVLVAGHRAAVVSWTEHEGDDHRVVARRTAGDFSGEEADRWGSTTRLSELDVAAGGSRLAMGGEDRVACVWTGGGRGKLATID